MCNQTLIGIHWRRMFVPHRQQHLHGLTPPSNSSPGWATAGVGRVFPSVLSPVFWWQQLHPVSFMLNLALFKWLQERQKAWAYKLSCTRLLTPCEGLTAANKRQIQKTSIYYLSLSFRIFFACFQSLWLNYFISVYPPVKLQKSNS